MEIKKTGFVPHKNKSYASDLNKFEDSITVQDENKSYEVKNIVNTFMKSGVPPKMSVPQFGDISDAKSYHEAVVAVQEAEEAFSQLPVNLRHKYKNDPKLLLEAVERGDFSPEKLQGDPTAKRGQQPEPAAAPPEGSSTKTQKKSGAKAPTSPESGDGEG